MNKIFYWHLRLLSSNIHHHFAYLFTSVFSLLLYVHSRNMMYTSAYNKLHLRMINFHTWLGLYFISSNQKSLSIN